MRGELGGRAAEGVAGVVRGEGAAERGEADAAGGAEEEDCLLGGGHGCVVLRVVLCSLGRG